MTPDNPFDRPPGLAAGQKPHPDAPGPVPYIAPPELIEAVNLAIFLNRPLLLEGEAGSGKSQLAAYVAHCLGLPLYRWPVRSTSSAQEGLYHYDAILRLHDVHLTQGWRKRPIGKRNPQEPSHYVRWGALGEAFQLKVCPAVVLIDEIDKADIDFPNDLLTVLDEPRSFEVHEIGEQPISATWPPIVIITSNKEKANLPAPFLRRCIYSYIRFPDDKATLLDIIAAHRATDDGLTRGLAAVDDELTDAAIGRFLRLRSNDDLFKKPGTSELLDWLRAFGRSAGERRDDLLSRLRDPKAQLPFPELLFKRRDDWQRHVTAR
jgi:MoxR-like ATPase